MLKKNLIAKTHSLIVGRLQILIVCWQDLEEGVVEVGRCFSLFFLNNVDVFFVEPPADEEVGVALVLMGAVANLHDMLIL